jgi:hypothetical protein
MNQQRSQYLGSLFSIRTSCPAIATKTKSQRAILMVYRDCRLEGGCEQLSEAGANSRSKTRQERRDWALSSSANVMTCQQNGSTKKSPFFEQSMMGQK